MASTLLTPVAVASLGTCDAAAKGTRRAANDALAPVIGTAVAGGGAAYADVSCDGSTWIVTGKTGALAAGDIPATPLTADGNTTLTPPRQYYVCTEACQITVPVPAAGYEFCVLNGNNVNTVITLNALGSAAMYENTARTAYGTAGTGTLVSSGAVGDKVCILGLDATHYLTVSYTGTWTAN